MASDIQSTVAQHHAEIAALGGRMSGVETGLRTLQGEVHAGFAGINTLMHSLDSKIDKFDSRPQFNLHQSTQTVLAWAILFSMVVGGIIWITSQLSVGTQLTVSNTSQDLSEAKKEIDALKEKLNWAVRVEKR